VIRLLLPRFEEKRCRTVIDSIKEEMKSDGNGERLKAKAECRSEKLKAEGEKLNAEAESGKGS